ncbi:S1 family peptidase [Pseudothauera rhizosphaerae]|uniref:S1 family peptidase n=1 Tax=Pseudothauera rhizosphaerae TaxID=2565932 RepID=UPI001454C502|nr:serine protease [Pseudothauera rhizosphaerae]
MLARRAVLAGLLCAASALHASPPQEPEAHATGIFLNMEGDVLTARHAVDGCRRLYALKDGRVAPAWVRATARDMDAAVLKTGLKPILAATFPVETPASALAVPVFAEGYSALQAMPDRARAMFNAVTVPGRERFSMMSPVRPGASGSAVLGADGRVLAMVVERAVVSPGAGDVRSLSRHAGRRLPAGGATEVAAVPAQAIKTFLRENFVGFDESEHAQLGHDQPGAPRAATLSAGVICEK